MISMGHGNAHVHADLRTDVIIVGGGLAGISCALGLLGSGLNVMLFEESDSPGGRARSWVDGKSGDLIDLGAYAIHSECINLLALLRQLGTYGRIVWQTDRLICLIGKDRGTAVDCSASALQGLRAGLASVSCPGLGRRFSSKALLWLALRLEEDGIEQLDDLCAIDLLQKHHIGPRAIEGPWTSICLSLLGVPPERCSACALMRVYAQLIRHRGCRMGFADCGLTQLYLPAALQSLGAAGTRVQLRSKVVALIYQEGVARGVVLADGTRVCASHCVMTVPPLALSSLLPARCRARPPFIDAHAFESTPHVGVYLWLDRKLTRECFWVRARSENFLNCQFYDLSNIRAGWHERSSVIAGNIMCAHRAENMSDREIVDATMRELAADIPQMRGAKILHVVVNRIPMAVPCPAPGTERKRPDVCTAVPGLLLAGDWTRTHLPACMDSAVRSGWLAAERIWGSLGRPRRLAPPARPSEGLAGLLQRYAAKKAPAGWELAA